MDGRLLRNKGGRDRANPKQRACAKSNPIRRPAGKMAVEGAQRELQKVGAGTLRGPMAVATGPSGYDGCFESKTSKKLKRGGEAA